MKGLLGILFSLASCFITNAQTITNTLKGYYSTSKNNVIYSTFYFDGHGHVLINGNFPGEYFQKDDKLYVFPNKNVFIFKLDKNKIIGTSSWVDRIAYKLKNNPLIQVDDDAMSKSYEIDPNLLDQFYRLNFKQNSDSISFSALEEPQKYEHQMEDLCNKKLTSACGAWFGISVLNEIDELESRLENEDLEVEPKPNIKIESIAQRMINLNDFRGYALLGSYYVMIGDLNKAKIIFKEGADKGDVDSIFALASLDMENFSTDLD